jgi:glycosyltransferase involved in cell wall biosynthesis
VMVHPDIGIFFGRPGRSEILAERLRARGFLVTVYSNRGLPGQYSPVRHSFLPALSCALSTDHQVYLTAQGFVPSLCLYLNRAVRGVPYIFNATGLKSATYRDRARRWLFSRAEERWFYPMAMSRVLAGASRIVCNSRYLRTKLALQFPQHAPKITTIYNGIEFERFASGRSIPIEGTPPEAAKLLAVMTWNYEGKSAGARLLIDAMGFITEKYPDARLIIAAKKRRDHYSDENEKYLSAKPWANAIKILYNRTDVPDLLASSDLFVYATPADSNDSLPRALIEAHAAGLPIVTTATAGCAEVVEDSVTGFAVRYDAKALAERVIDLLADAGKRREMGRRGREHVYDTFNWERMADAYADLFQQIVSGQTESLREKASQGI